MNMYIKKVIIERDGIPAFNLSFEERLTVVEENAVLYDVIRLLLGQEQPTVYTCDLRFVAVVSTDRIYCVCGEKNKKNSGWCLAVCTERGVPASVDTYFDTVATNEEMDALHFFEHFKRQDYPHRLLRYKEGEWHYQPGELEKITAGYGVTRTFHRYMTRYIRDFQPIRLREDKDLFLKLSPNGAFTVGYRDSDEKVFLSECEDLLYRYLCFLNLAEFWSGAEELRDLHRLNKPLLVSSFLDRLDASVNVDEVLRKTAALPRQTILFAPHAREDG